MEWAFEIFIRHHSLDKVEFIVNNIPFSDSKEKNVFYILSHTLPYFVLEDALKVLQENFISIVTKRDLKRNADAGYVDTYYSEHDKDMAIDECIKIYTGKSYSYKNLFYRLPIHLTLNEKEKQHLFNAFLRENRNIQAHPLIYHHNAPMKTLEANKFMDQNATPLFVKSVLGSEVEAYVLEDKEKISDYNQLLVKQPKAFARKYLGNNCPYFRPNLAFSDKEILTAVADILAKYRINQALGKAKILKQLPKWKENQILALWDLTEWGSKWTGKPLTQAELAVELWPYASRPRDAEVDYVDRIRKLSKRDMKIAMTEETYLLLLQADLTLIAE